MRTPAFWFAERGALAQSLRPAGFLYGACAMRRMARAGARMTAPVVTIGNFVAGGAGKTPAAIALARLLIARGETPAFLSRGYGGATAAPVRVIDQSAAQVGDEPILLARVAPTFVGRDRAAAAALAIDSARPSVLVLDDGLQSRRVEPDVALAIVDGETGLGNGLCIPAGPLRAPLAAQLRHVDAVIVVGAGAAGDRFGDEARRAKIPVFRARLDPDESARKFFGRKVVAFAGIARPEKFFATLDSLGAAVVDRRAFADHNRYSERDIAALQACARARNAALVTTEKDFVRLPALAQPHPAPEPVPIRLTFEPALEAFVLERLADKRRGSSA